MTIHAMPKALKFALMAMLVIVAAVISAVVFYRGETKTQEIAADTDSVPVDGPSQRFDELSTAQATLRQSLDALSDRLSRIDARISDLRTEVDDRLTAMQSGIDTARGYGDELNRLNRELEQHYAQLTALDERTASNATAIEQINTVNAARRMKPSKVRPDFTVFAIDQWGAQFSVVLNVGGVAQPVSLGDVVQGWSIEAVEYPDCIDIKRSSDGISDKICTEGR